MIGISLIECLITLFCVAILAVMAITSNSAWLTQQQTQMVVEKLVQDLQFAREQALLRNTIITLCPTLNQQSCSSSAAWALGYLVFVDPNGKANADNAAEILSSTLLPTAGILSNTRTYIQFSSNGFTRTSNSTFIYSLDESERKVIINLQGRIRVE